MKKILIGTSLVVVLIVGILALNFTSKENKSEKSNNGGENTLENFKVNLEGKKIITSNSITDKALSEDFANLVKHSDAVIKGKVKAVNFETFVGNAWTRITLHIDDVFKGEVKKDQDIDIYYLGGYVSLNDHIKFYQDSEKFSNLNKNERSNTILREIIDGEEEFVNPNEELVLCIVKTSEASPLPKGSYERLYAAGMLKQKGNEYVQLYGEATTKYSVAKSKVNKIVNLEDK